MAQFFRSFFESSIKLMTPESYKRVPGFEDSQQDQSLSDDETSPSNESEKRNDSQKPFALKGKVLIASAIIFGILATLFFTTHKSHTHPSNPCQHPAIRREWRTLSKKEKNHYITSVKCLGGIAPRVRENGTLYDDFPWVHSDMGHMIHRAAPFFPWHRWFIHVYETALIEYCGYTGSLPYWDWTLDWEDIAGSLVWDNETGFGGNGRGGPVDGPDTVGHGRCVIDGPFADLRPAFYAHEDYPHCLSRGFIKGFSGYANRPEAMEKIYLKPDYESFLKALELGPHDNIPTSIRGEFFTFTAPYDPLFFIHHANIDRIWWLWQERDLDRRAKDYSGIADTHTGGIATIHDVLPMGGLSRDITVEEAMRTESEHLCYRYF